MPNDLVNAIIGELYFASQDHDYNPDERIWSLCRRAGIMDLNKRHELITQSRRAFEILQVCDSLCEHPEG